MVCRIAGGAEKDVTLSKRVKQQCERLGPQEEKGGKPLRGYMSVGIAICIISRTCGAKKKILRKKV